MVLTEPTVPDSFHSESGTHGFLKYTPQASQPERTWQGRTGPGPTEATREAAHRAPGSLPPAHCPADRPAAWLPAPLPLATPTVSLDSV